MDGSRQCIHKHRRKTMPNLAHVSRALNLYSADGTQNYKVALAEDAVNISSTLPISFGTLVNIGSHTDVETLLTALQADVVANAATASAQASAVQSNLDSYIASTNAQVSSCFSGIADESAAREADVSVINTSIATETADRSTAVTAVQNDLATERARIDDILAGSTIDLNAFAELVAAFEAADSSILGTIAGIQSSLSLLTGRVNELTAP